MKPIANILFYIVLMVMTPACIASDDTILEYKDVNLDVTELPNRTPLTLKISGLAFHSVLSVEKITTKTEGASLIVYVHLTIAKPGLSGRFEHELSVPDSINQVQFGNGKHTVWKRKSVP